MGPSPRRKKKITKKQKNIGRITAQRDLFWTKEAVKKNYRNKLSGYSGILLIILISAAEK